jgi:hypothetical protein
VTTKIFFLFSIVLWLIWAGMYFPLKDIETMKQSARRDLIALRSRVRLSPDSPIDRSFQVYYDEPHYVGFELDDKHLADSLERYTGYYTPPDFGLNLNWNLYEGSDSIQYLSSTFSSGVYGRTLAFGQFHPRTGRQYKIKVHTVALPHFAVTDSAWLEIGVSRAAVSVGNELFYGVADLLFSRVRPITFWVAVGMSFTTFLMWVMKRTSRVNST